MEKKKSKGKLIALIIAIVVVVGVLTTGIVLAATGTLFGSTKEKAFDLLKQAPEKMTQSAVSKQLNGLSGERPQPPDVISALAAVELRQVDDAAVQKSGHCLRFRIGKHAHCLDPGGEERFEPLGLPGGDIPLAAWHKHEPDKFGLHPVGRRNILRA